MTSVMKVVGDIDTVTEISDEKSVESYLADFALEPMWDTADGAEMVEHYSVFHYKSSRYHFRKVMVQGFLVRWDILNDGGVILPGLSYGSVFGIMRALDAADNSVAPLSDE